MLAFVTLNAAGESEEVSIDGIVWWEYKEVCEDVWVTDHLLFAQWPKQILLERRV